MSYFNEDPPSYIFKNCQEAIWSLVEQLYQSQNAIDKTEINAAFIYLCETYNINKNNLEYGLNIEHKREIT